MTVARDRSAWGRKVEYKARTSSGLIHESPPDIERNTNDILLTKIGLDRRFNGKKNYCALLAVGRSNSFYCMAPLTLAEIVRALITFSVE
jgi:hypothetical protein